MKKRLMALVCAAVLTVGMSMTAFATNPSVVAGVVTGIEKAVDKNGAAIDVEGTDAKIVVENLPKDKYVEEIKYIEANYKKELGDAYKEGMVIIDEKNVRVVGDPALINWDATITFTANGVKAGEEVVLLHYDETAKDWEVIKATAGDETIKATFDSLSPVVFVKVGPVASPTTGEPVSLMVAGVAVALGTVGTVVSRKRK